MIKIASTLPLSLENILQLKPASIIFLSADEFRCEGDVMEKMVRDGIGVLLTDRIPSGAALRTWHKACNRTIIVLVMVPLGNADCFTSQSEGVICVFFSGGTTPIGRAIAAAEAIYTREVTARETTRLVSNARRASAPERVLVVGSGIVGLMTAMALTDEGYEVEVVEKGPKPRDTPDWRSLGCTHGGANARMFSLTECDNYHDRDADPDGKLHGYLRKSITEMGWLIGTPDAYTAEDETWILESLAMPVWLAEQYNDDIFALNHESLGYWRHLMAERPQLFGGVRLCSPLLRVASTPSYHDKQVKRQKRVGAFLHELDQDETASTYPALADGCRNAEIVGGIEVTGFTVNVHSFVNNLIDHLTAQGVVFRWNAQADRIVTESGVVTGIRVNGRVEQSDHYFLSPGTYGGELLAETGSAHKIHGVLGAWLSILNLEPKLNTALKIAREGHIASCGNIIPVQTAEGDEILVFGSGFGYVGHNPENIDPAQLEALYASMEDYLACMFPAAFAQAQSSGQLHASRKYCIRPWTATSLGLFEIQPAETGLLVIASGHNTGGFAQSTGVARATIDAFQGRQHPMHTLYHPQRFDRFWLGRERPNIQAAPDVKLPEPAIH